MVEALHLKNVFFFFLTQTWTAQFSPLLLEDLSSLLPRFSNIRHSCGSIPLLVKELLGNLWLELRTYHHIVNAHAHKSGIVDLLQLDAACFVCKKDAKDQQNPLVAKQHPWRLEKNMYLQLDFFNTWWYVLCQILWGNRCYFQRELPSPPHPLHTHIHWAWIVHRPSSSNRWRKYSVKSN